MILSHLTDLALAVLSTLSAREIAQLEAKSTKVL